MINENKHKNILSMGAGPHVLEYLLKVALPEETNIFACDFDSYLVNKATHFFPEITVVRFDFFKDDFSSLKKRLNVELDLIVFFGCTYTMDNPQFIALFNDLKKNGAKQIIDFYAG